MLPNFKSLKDMTLLELKALAYDEYVRFQNIQRFLREVQNEIDFRIKDSLQNKKEE